MDRVIIRSPVRYNYDKINEFRRLFQKHRSLQKQVARISFAGMAQLSKDEYEETKRIFKEIRLQSITISDGLAFLLARFYDENVLINAEYKVISELDPKGEDKQ